MDKRKALTREEALALVRRYKAVIRPHFDVELLGGITAGDPASGVRAFVLNFGDDEATGIIEIEGAGNVREVKDNHWYTLDGRRLNAKPTQKGLYINNGVKVVIK